MCYDATQSSCHKRPTEEGICTFLCWKPSTPVQGAMVSASWEATWHIWKIIRSSIHFTDQLTLARHESTRLRQYIEDEEMTKRAPG